MAAMFRTLAVLAVLAAPVPAQSASFLLFGNPCDVLPPPVAALTLPRIGTTFELQTLSSFSRGYDGGMASALLVGTSNTSWMGLPLPWTSLTFQSQIGAYACGDLMISVDTFVQMPWVFGSRQPITTYIPIPNSPALLGTSAFFQAVDYRVNTRGVLGLTFGPAGEARLGT